MEKKDIIELTNKLYRITLLFPKKEPLRYRIREAGDRVLENVAALEVFHTPYQRDNFLPVDNLKEKNLLFELKKDLNIIISYFEVVKYQNWISYFEVLEIQNKYDKIKSNLEDKLNIVELEKKPEVVKTKKDKDLDDRKQKILMFLKEKDQAQVWQVKEYLPEVSKRTLRRDFEYLLKQGLVQRIGERNNTFYKLS